MRRLVPHPYFMIHDLESILLKNDITKDLLCSRKSTENTRNRLEPILEPILREYLMLSGSTILPKTTA